MNLAISRKFNDILYKDKFMERLTKSQYKALTLISENDGVSYSPGDSIYVGKQLIRWDVIRRLKEKKLLIGFDLHPWGPYPVYGMEISDFGKKVLKEYRG